MSDEKEYESEPEYEFLESELEYDFTWCFGRKRHLAPSLIEHDKKIYPVLRDVNEVERGDPSWLRDSKNTRRYNKNKERDRLVAESMTLKNLKGETTRIPDTA